MTNNKQEIPMGLDELASSVSAALPADVRECYDRGGIAAVDAALSRTRQDSVELAKIYKALSKALHRVDPAGCCEAARRAFALEPNALNRRWLGFRTFDLGQIGEAWALLVALPKKADLSSWEKRQKDRIFEQVQILKEALPLNENELNSFKRGGVELVISEIFARKSDDAQAYAKELIKASKKLLNAGYKNAEFSLTTEALNIFYGEVTLRAQYYALLRQFDIFAALDCVKKLESLYNDAPSLERTKIIHKMKSHSSYIISILETIPGRRSPEIEVNNRRICYVLHNSLPYSTSGYATRSQGMAIGLMENGWDVQCVTRPGFPVDMQVYQRVMTEKGLPLVEQCDAVTYTRILQPSKVHSKKLDYLYEAADALESTFRDLRPELVWAASDHMTGLPALIAARRLGIPFVYEVRGLWEVTKASRQPDYLNNILYKVDILLGTALCNAADHVFTLTNQMRDELAGRGVTTSISLLPNSCDIGRFDPIAVDVDRARSLDIPPGIPVIGYIGSFVQYEGLDDLTRACAILASRGVDFRLLLVGDELTSSSGDGPVTLDIKHTAQQAGLEDRLIMTGRVPHEEVESYYSIVDIAAFPRKPQPVTELVSPIKPLEALAMEKAVVVSSVQALAEMIDDGVTGLVFRKGDIDDLADQLERLIADPALRASLGQAGRAWVERERTWRSTAGAATAHLQRISSVQSQGPTAECQ